MNDQYNLQNDPNQVGDNETPVAPTYSAPSEAYVTERATARNGVGGPPESPAAVPATPSPYFGTPVRAESPIAPAASAKIKRGVPGLTAFGFTLALLSLFLVPFFKDAFEGYLFYDGTESVVLQYYFYATWILGAVSGLFALIAFILTPFGGSVSKRQQRDGRGLAVAGTLIAFVALLLTVGVAVSHYLLFMQIYPS